MNIYRKVSKLTKNEWLCVKGIYYERFSTSWMVSCNSMEISLFPCYVIDGKLDYNLINYTEYPELALEVLEELKEYHHIEFGKLIRIEDNVNCSMDKYVLDYLDFYLDLYLNDL